MDDNSVSSDSSRGASPSSDDMHRRAANSPCSITELSRQFDQHTLEPQKGASLPRAPPCQSYHLHHTQGRDLLCFMCNHHTTRGPRESMIRRQYSAASISRLSPLVQDLLGDEGSTHDTSYISPLSDSDSAPPLSSHKRPRLASPTISLASNSSCSEDREFDPERSSETGPTYSAGKDLRHSTSREGFSRQFKNIRVRKASRRRCPTLAG